MAFYTYMLASRRNGTLYIGHTDDLPRRVFEHEQKAVAGFTADHGVSRLVWYETHDTREAAFTRDRQIKKWNRDCKLSLIESDNPDWEDRLPEFA